MARGPSVGFATRGGSSPIQREHIAEPAIFGANDAAAHHVEQLLSQGSTKNGTTGGVVGVAPHPYLQGVVSAHFSRIQCSCPLYDAHVTAHLELALLKTFEPLFSGHTPIGISTGAVAALGPVSRA